MRPIKPMKHVGEVNNKDQVQTQLYKVLRGNVSYGRQVTGGYTEDNIDGVFAPIADTGTASTEFIVPHNLNRIPVGYHVVKKSIFSDFQDGITAWDSKNIYLKASAANVNVVFFVF